MVLILFTILSSRRLAVNHEIRTSFASRPSFCCAKNVSYSLLHVGWIYLICPYSWAIHEYNVTCVPILEFWNGKGNACCWFLLAKLVCGMADYAHRTENSSIIWWSLAIFYGGVFGAFSLFWDVNFLFVLANNKYNTFIYLNTSKSLRSDKIASFCSVIVET